MTCPGNSRSYGPFHEFMQVSEENLWYPLGRAGQSLGPPENTVSRVFRKAAIHHKQDGRCVSY